MNSLLRGVGGLVRAAFVVVNARALLSAFFVAAVGVVLVLMSFPSPSHAQELAWALTAIAGLKVGQVTLSQRPTGCTVVLAEGRAVGGGVGGRAHGVSHSCTGPLNAG